MPVTLKDVAKLANVSPIVVSRVLHNKANGVRVSAATAERVRKAAADLDYKVNIWARNFRAQQTMMLGVLNGMGMDRPLFNHGPRYFATLMDGIVEGAFRHDYSVALCPQLLGDNPTNAMSDGRFDGLVWYSITPTETNRAVLDASRVPVVIVHAKSEDYGSKHPTVICDNDQGVGLGVDHLFEMGHRRIAFAIESDALNVESAARLAAYKSHMARLGLPIDDQDILDFHKDRVALNRYLAEGPRHSAIICHGDGLAADIINLAPVHGVSIPADLSVIGFDSTEFCDELRPRLTSIRQPLFDMGSKAVELLIRAIAEHRRDSLESVLPCALDVRESTSPPKA